MDDFIQRQIEKAAKDLREAEYQMDSEAATDARRAIDFYMGQAEQRKAAEGRSPPYHLDTNALMQYGLQPRSGLAGLGAALGSGLGGLSGLGQNQELARRALEKKELQELYEEYGSAPGKIGEKFMIDEKEFNPNDVPAMIKKLFVPSPERHGKLEFRYERMMDELFDQVEEMKKENKKLRSRILEMEKKGVSWSADQAFSEWKKKVLENL